MASRVQYVDTSTSTGQPSKCAGSTEIFENLTRAEQYELFSTNRRYWPSTGRTKWICCRSQSPMHVGEKAKACKFIRNKRAIQISRSTNLPRVEQTVAPPESISLQPINIATLEQIYQSQTADERKVFISELLQFAASKVASM